MAARGGAQVLTGLVAANVPDTNIDDPVAPVRGDRLSALLFWDEQLALVDLDLVAGFYN